MAGGALKASGESVPSAVRISAVISAEAWSLLEQFSRSSGKSKDWVIETALRHHLQVMSEIPSEAVAPKRIVVTGDAGQRLLALLQAPPDPTGALGDLFTPRQPSKGLRRDDDPCTSP